MNSFWASNFNQSCTLIISGDPDEWGNREVTTRVTVPCWYRMTRQRVRTQSGELFNSVATVVVAPDLDVHLDDSLTLSDDTRIYTVKEMEYIRDTDDQPDALRLYAM
jgi:hypothetical protein